MLRWLNFVTSAALVAPVCTTGQATKEAPPRPADAVVSKIRSELRRIEGGHASDFLAALSRPDEDGAQGRLSNEQAELIRRLDDLGKDAASMWLTRMLEEGPSSLTPDQVELSIGRVAAHVEAMAIEAVLTPTQTRRWRWP